jgi:hypothetical protein
MMDTDNTNMDVDVDVIGQLPQAFNHGENLEGTVMFGRTEEDFANINPQADKINLLAQVLEKKGFEVIYIGMFGVSISAPATVYHKVFGLELNVNAYKNTMHFIDFVDNEDSALNHETLSLHFSGDVEYFGDNDIDVME